MPETCQRPEKQPCQDDCPAAGESKSARDNSADLFKAGKYQFLTGRQTFLIGILNTTPDSFSDGGLYLSRDQALFRAEEMIRQGVDIIDVGGESTRPGSEDVSEHLEIERTAPVVSAVVSNFDIPVSIDSYKYEVAKEAVAAGACIINDIYGLLHDPRLAALAAQYQCGLIVMHNARYYRFENTSHAGSHIKAAPSFMHELKDKDLVESVLRYLNKSIETACAAGVKPAYLLLDPGIGFGIETAESIQLIKRLSDFRQLGRPILLGPSRKRFIGELTGTQVDHRLLGTAAAVTAGIAAGADFVRIHDVAAMKEVVLVADAIFKNKGTIIR